MNLNKAQMHKRPTYETLVKDTILEPKDKIALPDRAATILTKTKQLTRYDDAEFLDMEKDNEQIAKEKAQQLTVGAAAAASTGSITQQQAAQPGPHQGHTFVNPPAPAHPSTRGPPRTNSAKPAPRGQPQAMGPSPAGPAQTFGPPSSTPSSAAAASSSSAPAAQPAQHFATGIDESADDAKVETEKVFAEADRQAAMKAEAIQRQIAANLGPSAGTADASYISRLAADAGNGKGRGYGPAKVEPAPREGMDKTHSEQMGKMFQAENVGDGKQHHHHHC